MTETVTCPADGCDYTGVKDSVLGHYSGKRDGEHEGGYPAAKKLLNDGETSTDTAGSGETSSGGGNPVFGSADPESDSGGSDGVELPCGCESYDESEAPEPPFKVTCSSCGKRYRVKE